MFVPTVSGPHFTPVGRAGKEDQKSKRTGRRYRVEEKQLSVDTPENRFIKMVVNKSRKQLADFERRLRANNEVPERQRLSDSFLNELHDWQMPMQKMLEQSFLQDVGDYSGMSRVAGITSKNGLQQHLSHLAGTEMLSGCAGWTVGGFHEICRGNLRDLVFFADPPDADG